MDCAAYREWVAADVDGVESPELAEARLHLQSCSSCRAVHADVAAVRRLLRARPPLVAAPVGLRTRIRATLDEEAAAMAPLPLRVRLLRAAAFACLVLVAVTMLRPVSAPDDSAVESYHLALRGELPFSVESEEIAKIEEYYRRVGGPEMPSHVVDLSAAGFGVRGGLVRDVGGRRLRLTLYSDGQHLIVCDYRPLRGYAGTLPIGDRPLFYSRGGLTFCVTRMGNDVCILVTRLPMHVIEPRLTGAT